jgi:very-short-patch-repair endonuclease
VNPGLTRQRENDIIMTEFFNRKDEAPRRRELRNAMPKAEVVLWSRLKGRQLLGCKFRRQYGVGPFVIDFYSPEIKLGIELDGDSHFAEGKREYDRKRQAFIESFGIRIIRFLNVDIYDNLDGVLEAIAREVLEKRAEKQPPSDPCGDQPREFPPYEGGTQGGPERVDDIIECAQ